MQLKTQFECLHIKNYKLLVLIYSDLQIFIFIFLVQ